MNHVYFFEDKSKISVLLSDGTVFSWGSDSPKFEMAKALVHKDNEGAIRLLINETKAIMSGDINIKEGTVSGIKTESKLMQLIQMCREKGLCEESIEHIKPFLENCLKNPYINAVEEILDFVTKLELYITSDGCFLAYKNVCSDLKSIHDGKTMHNIGTYVEETNFDCDRTRTCSAGLHFCSKDYLKSYPGDVTICVKVNPIDVVAIPVDYNFEKGRCCKYYVVGIMPTDTFFSDENFDVAEYFGIDCVDASDEYEEYEENTEPVTEAPTNPKITPRMLEIVNYVAIFGVKSAAISLSISEETVKRTVRKYKQLTRGE